MVSLFTSSTYLFKNGIIVTSTSCLHLVIHILFAVLLTASSTSSEAGSG